MTREQEIWAMALWVERHHEGNGRDVIADLIAVLEREGEHEGGASWREVEKSRYSQLKTGIIPIHGQPEYRKNELCPIWSIK